MHDIHVVESAELYALGLLEPSERAEIDAHVATCSECRRALGAAEETVLALEREVRDVEPPYELDRAMHFTRPARRLTLPAWLAVAAAFIVGLLPSIPLLVQQTQMHRIHDVAAVAMINSHFNHAEFTSAATAAPHAKVIYARDGAWLYVIVEGTHRFEVDAAHGGTISVLGVTQPAGTTSELFIKPPQRADSLQLRQGKAIVETAKLR